MNDAPSADVEVDSYELRDRRTGACHSACATEIGALARAELIARTEGPGAIWWLLLVRVTPEGVERVIAEGSELLERQPA